MGPRFNGHFEIEGGNGPQPCFKPWGKYHVWTDSPVPMISSSVQGKTALSPVLSELVNYGKGEFEHFDMELEIKCQKKL